MKLDAAIVMPDHIHFIAALKNAGLPKLMQSLKGYTSREINSLMNKKGVFWQDQYHEHAIRKDEVLNEVVCTCSTTPSGLVWSKTFTIIRSGIAVGLCKKESRLESRSHRQATTEFFCGSGFPAAILTGKKRDRGKSSSHTFFVFPCGKRHLPRFMTSVAQ